MPSWELFDAQDAAYQESVTAQGRDQSAWRWKPVSAWAGAATLVLKAMWLALTASVPLPLAGTRHEGSLATPPRIVVSRAKALLG